MIIYACYRTTRTVGNRELVIYFYPLHRRSEYPTGWFILEMEENGEVQYCAGAVLDTGQVFNCIISAVEVEQISKYRRV